MIWSKRPIESSWRGHRSFLFVIRRAHWRLCNQIQLNRNVWRRDLKSRGLREEPGVDTRKRWRQSCVQNQIMPANSASLFTRRSAAASYSGEDINEFRLAYGKGRKRSHPFSPNPTLR